MSTHALGMVLILAFMALLILATMMLLVMESLELDERATRTMLSTMSMPAVEINDATNGHIES